MTLEQLRIFVAVAELQHVTRAAQTLNLAQSAASHAIAALEETYQTKLFSRVGRHIELTHAGRAFLTEAREVLARAERAELALSEFASLKRGTLSMQASHTISGYWLPRHLAAFRRAYPQIEIQLTIGNTAQVAAAVQSGVAEIGLVEGEIKSDDLEATAIARDQLMIVVAPGHPWADEEGLDARDLLRGDWVLREVGSGTRSVLESALKAMGSRSKFRVVLELPSNEAVRAAVEAGIGASALSASVIAPSIEVGLLKSVKFSLPEREYYVLHHRERYLSRAGKSFLAALKAFGR